MKSLILLRKTENWATVSEDTYFDNYRKKFAWQLETYAPDQYWRFLYEINNWNHSVDFFQYRANLAEVAKDTWKDTGIDVVNCEDLKADHDFDGYNKDLILIPTDDDDWFCPDLHNKLETVFIDPNVSLVMWQTPCWHPNLLKDLKTTQYAASNGYAFRASMVEKDRNLIHDHTWPHKHPKIFKSQQLGNSIWLRHCACWTVMSGMSNRSGEFTFTFAPMTIPKIDDSITWAEKHIYKLLSLNKELPTLMV